VEQPGRWHAAVGRHGAAGARGGPLIGYVAAALGGALGSLARWGLGVALPHPAGAWPTATLVVNLTGCLLLGLLAAALFARHPRSPWLRPLLGTGVLAVQLADAGRGAAAAGYVLVSVVGGLLAAAAGVRLGRAVTARRVDHP